MITSTERAILSFFFTRGHEILTFFFEIVDAELSNLRPPQLAGNAHSADNVTVTNSKVAYRVYSATRVTIDSYAYSWYYHTM